MFSFKLAQSFHRLKLLRQLPQSEFNLQNKNISIKRKRNISQIKLTNDYQHFVSSISNSVTKRDFTYQTNKMIIPRFLSQQEAIALDQELFQDYCFSVDQLMELAGLSVACAIYKAYPNKNCQKKIVICCGPGNNGGDGLVCARHLKQFGYWPVIVYPKEGKSQLFQNLVKQCKMMDIPFVNENDESFNFSDRYDLIVDAIFGFSYRPPLRNDSLCDLLKSIEKLSRDHRKPIVSVDIPSGWSVEDGPPSNVDQDGNQVPVIMPDCLISLTAPKKCAKYFKGSFHFLGGRFCPESLQAKYNLCLPVYPDAEQVVLLKSE